MAETQITRHASFEAIRYAQLWEDADVLVDALGPQAGNTLVSICSAGDNALAMLTLDPARIVAFDLSSAQLACLAIRKAAYRSLDHRGLLELLGSRPSDRRADLLESAARTLSHRDQRFWAERRDDILRYGLAGIGKFERYFRIFRSYLLPLVHGGRTIDAVFERRDRAARAQFVDTVWNNRRWRLLLSVFFSNAVMGRLGRDPAFFAHVEGSLSDHVARRIRHAAVDLDPADNPYLHWILKGGHGAALPLAWREEHFETIRSRLDRIEARQGPLEAFAAGGEKADGFNLSDIFEYMDEDGFRAAFQSVVDAANPGARLVYWNMMVPRRAAGRISDRVRPLTAREQAGRASDKAFFYSDFIVEEVL